MMSVPRLMSPSGSGTQTLTRWLMGQQTGTTARSSGSSEIVGTTNHSPFNVSPPFASPATSTTQPRAYNPTLTPLSSPLRPHCLAKDRLCLWCPSLSCVALDHNGIPLPLSEADLNCILTVIGHSLASGTKEVYGSGLLVYHVFCDARSISEDQRGPASSLLLLSFIATCAGVYSGKTLENYLYGVRAWHLLHGLMWLGHSEQISSALTGAARLAPPPSKRLKCQPFTLDIIITLHSTLDLSAPLDAAVYACLIISFFMLAWLGEVTVRSLNGFDPALNVKVSDIHYAQDRHGLKVTVLHLPHSKMSVGREDLYFAPQIGEVDPQMGLEAHLRVNTPPPQAALFSWRHQNGLRPLTRSEFLRRLERASSSAGIVPLKGHGIRIGGTLEYLLCGVPFETVKLMGRWGGDAFLVYLRQHTVVMAPYLHDSPILEPFTCYVMPPVR